MKLALAILFIFFGASLVYVSAHGIGSTTPGFWSIWSEVLHGIEGEPAESG